MNMTFWKTFWASLLASVIAGIIVVSIFFLILNMMLAGFGAMFDEKPLVVKEKTVLHMTLNGRIGDYTKTDVEADLDGIRPTMNLGVVDIIEGLKLAEEDENIEGIFLNCDGVMTGMANVKEIRDALQRFQKSGKFVVAFNENYSTKAYYLSSVAEELYVFPTGMLQFLGLGAEMMYFKNTLEKLDVEMQIIRGSNNKFKSAVEPLMNDKMSDAAREQSLTYLNAMWGEIVKAVGKSRGLKRSKLNEIADSISIRQSGDAVEFGMADGICYYDQVIDTLKTRVGLALDDTLTLLSFDRYASKKLRQKHNLAKMDKKNLAVIFAEGEIVDGWGGDNQIGGYSLAADLRSARKDDDIKAVVLRVNSPGGSALASDIIWREVVMTKKARKPIIVSMGNLAASGGYYIACAADKIYAQPNTITGSIGVFAVIPYLGDMMTNHLGVTFDRVQTNQHMYPTPFERLTEKESRIVQEEIDAIYDDFISKVGKGRGMKKSEVDSIGQGRVWAGKDAIKIGLVDEFGSLEDAIQDAAERAKISHDSISIRYYPAPNEDKMYELITALQDADMETSTSSGGLESRFLEVYNYLKTLQGGKSIQARLPYMIWIE